MFCVVFTTIKRSWIPYGRLISEILHQGGILNALKEVNYFTDAQLGTVTGKIINGSTLKHMKLIKKEDYKVLSTDLKESTVLSNLMDDFPPICKQDHVEVQASPGLAVLQRNAELENENKQLKKELLEQKLLLIKYKSSTETKLEEARIREEKLIQSNEDFKREMKQKSEETNKMMEMFQKQAKP